jgi:hypothetical protein
MSPYRMTYSSFIELIYSEGFWARVAKYAIYDFSYPLLRDTMLESYPDPNVVLLTGVRENLGTYDESQAPDVLDLPFETCVFEATDSTLFNLPTANPDYKSQDIQVLFITELREGYGFIGMTSEGHFSWAVDPEKDTYKIFMTCAQSLLNFVNSRNTQIGQARERIKFKHKKFGSRFIKKVVHMRPKKYEEGFVAFYSGYPVDWSHRWEVRGHKRFIGEGKLGKDRNGNYTWKSYTWVKSHTKGPEDKDLVKKIRVAKNYDNPNISEQVE